MRDFVINLYDFTKGLDLNIFKVSDSEKETLIESMDENKTIVFKMKTKQPLGHFNGVYGINNLNLLRGLCTHVSFKNSDIEYCAINDSESNQQIPSCLIFRENNQEAMYRFMNPQLIPNQAIFKNPDWDIVFQPSQSKINEMASFSTLYSNNNLFMPYVQNKLFKFVLGDPMGADHKLEMIFHENVEGKFPKGLYWPVNQFLTILKYDTKNTTLYFNNKGAMMIIVDNDFAEYKYILPAKKK